MLDIKYIRENKEKIKEVAKFKNANVDIDNLLKLDKKRKEFLTEIDKLRTERNELAKTGKIINISDIAGIKPWADYILYCTSKAGLNGATKALAKELAPDFCVNAIAMGIAELGEDFTEEEKERQLSFIPAGRFAKPNEITKAIIFMLKNDYITGQILNVDGGRCI